MKYMLDGIALDLSVWMPTGGGGWKSLALNGDPWMAAVWQPNDPTAPLPSPYVHRSAETEALVREEAARIVAAGVATYRRAAHGGRLWCDYTPIVPRGTRRTPEDVEHAACATAAQPWAAERTLTGWGDGALPRTPEAGAMALRLGARAIEERAPDALRHRVGAVCVWLATQGAAL